jgi:hypothetical protein
MTETGFGNSVIEIWYLFGACDLVLGILKGLANLSASLCID